MIKSFRHKGVEDFFNTGSKAGINPDHGPKLARQLTTLDALTSLKDVPPNWALHPLKGELEGHWSIKVNGSWRLTFRFVDNDIEVVDYQDYH